MVDDGETWRAVIGQNNLPDLSLSGVLFCFRHGLTIMNTMFEQKVVHKRCWYQRTLDHKLMINFVVVSS